MTLATVRSPEDPLTPEMKLQNLGLRFKNREAAGYAGSNRARLVMKADVLRLLTVSSQHQAHHPIPSPTLA